MKTFTSEVVRRLEEGESFTLATIVTRNGSAPRSTGAQMTIAKGGSITGTIGGGLLEAETIKNAGQVFNTHQPHIKEFHLTGKDAAATDMICGGNQEVLIEFLDHTDSALLSCWQSALRSEQTRQRGWWVIQLPGSEQAGKTIPRWFVSADGTVTARPGASVMVNIMLQMNPEKTTSTITSNQELLLEVDKSMINIGLPRESMMIPSTRDRFYIEPLSSYGTVYIFGAGHISQKLAVMTGMVGFRTVVLDDREEYANKVRFPTADSVVVVNDNRIVFQDLPLDPESYLVIVTRGHLHDKDILQQALLSEAVYVGMIGSKRKREEIYRALEKEGFLREQLEKVYSPIGISIGAESPEEIAVSITAELIQVRNNHNKAKL